MKRQKQLSRVVSLVLTLSMVIGMLPTAVFAAEEDNAPDVLEYKGMSMVNLTGGQWVSRFEFDNFTNSFYLNPVSFAPGRTLTRVAYTIEKGQSVSFQLYHFNGDIDNLTYHKGNGGEWYTYD